MKPRKQKREGLTEDDIKILLKCIEASNYEYARRGGSRDYYYEDRIDEIKKKLSSNKRKEK